MDVCCGRISDGGATRGSVDVSEVTLPGEVASVGVGATPQSHPAAQSKKLPRRRPSGAAPPLPHHLHTTGLGWLIALVAVVSATLIVFRNGLVGVAIPVTVVDDTIVRWVSGLSAPGLYKLARMMTALSSWWIIQILSTAVPLTLLVLRRWRHLLVTEIVIQLALHLQLVVYNTTARPRPFGVALRAGWGGWALPSAQMLAIAGNPVVVH
jgi:hypothetical protein